MSPRLPEIKIHLAKGATLPQKATGGSAGRDVCACLPPDTMVRIPPGEKISIPTGLTMEIPEGYMVSLRPRSGLAAKNGVTLPNTPATIDSDYRGEVRVVLINLGREDALIEHGQRICQMLLEKVQDFDFQTVERREDLSGSDRGTGGFGSTG